MATLRALTLHGVPVLLAEPVPTAVAYAAPQTVSHPVVLWNHGFRADALAHATELLRCADAGFLAVGIDAVGHGARRDPTMDERLRQSPGGALPVMLDIVAQTAQEIPGVLDVLAFDYGADRSRVAMVGISMGAFLTYRCIADGVPLRSAVALLGSPEWPGADSAHRALPAFDAVSLLSITAEHDVSVPPAPVYRLHTALAQREPAPVHAHHVLKGSGHLTSAAHWHEEMGNTMAWLMQHTLD